MDVALLPLWLRPYLLNRHAVLHCCLLQTPFDQHPWHVLHWCVLESLRHLLPAHLIPKPIRSYDEVLVFGSEVEYLDFRVGANVRASIYFKGRLKLVLPAPVAGVVKLAVLESQISQRPGGLEPAFDIADSVVGPLAVDDVIFVGEGFFKSFLLLWVVSI